MKCFEDWWVEHGKIRNLKKKDLCRMAWEAGQDAVEVTKIYHKGKGKPSTFELED